MNDSTLDRPSLRLAATLLLAGQLLYVVVTLFHAGGEANDHQAIFAAYAASGIWTAVHMAQFGCMAMMLAGLVALFFALDPEPGVARWAGLFGVISTVTTLALYGVVLAIDGVALKQAVNAWASAPESEKAARFATTEAIRWLEWGTRSYENIALGLAMLLFAIAIGRTARLPRAIAWLMAFSGATCWVQGWTAGTQGFSHAHTVAIVVAEGLNAMWMSWLVVVGWRTEGSRSVVSEDPRARAVGMWR